MAELTRNFLLCAAATLALFNSSGIHAELARPLSFESVPEERASRQSGGVTKQVPKAAEKQRQASNSEAYGKLAHQAEIFERQGLMLSCASLHAELLELDRVQFGADSRQYNDRKLKLAQLTWILGDSDKSEMLFNDVKEYYELQPDQSVARLGETYSGLARLYESIDKSKEAENYLHKAANTLKNYYGNTHIEYGEALSRIGLFYRRQGKVPVAEQTLLKASEIMSQLGAEGKDGDAENLYRLARFFRTTGNFYAAEEIFLKLCREKKAGGSTNGYQNVFYGIHYSKQCDTGLDVDEIASSESIDAMLMLTSQNAQRNQNRTPSNDFLYDYRKSNSEKIEYIQRIALGRDKLPKKLANLAVVYRDQGQITRAGLLFNWAYALAERKPDASPEEKLRLLNNLADVWDTQRPSSTTGKIYADEASREHQVALSPFRIRALTRSALSANAVAQPDKYSETALLEALLLAEQYYGTSSIEVAEALINLGEYYNRGGSYAGYLDLLYQRSLYIMKNSGNGADDRYLATLLVHAKTLGKNRKYQEADRLYQTALSLAIDRYGDDSLEVAEIRFNIGKLYWSGHYRNNDAQALFLKSVTTFEHLLGPNHPYLGWKLRYLSYTYFKSNPAKKKELELRAESIAPYWKGSF